MAAIELSSVTPPTDTPPPSPEQADCALASVDPVATQWHAVDLDDALQHATVGLDHLTRTEIVVVAGHQGAFDPARPSDHETLAQNLRRMPATPVVWAYRIADVSALHQQGIVQLEADRRAPDDGTVDVCDQPRRFDPAGVEGTTVPLVLDHLHELDERLTRLQESKHEVIGLQLALSCEHLDLIAGRRQSEP